ncbi:hypothetical protein AYO22_04610 [Fonsecaea multimorphosa]|nr:hypothetical protein AYO22_04610 [Fonsecaea multimorphosa]
MLDEIHTSLPTRRRLNAYTLGRIGSHNIVVAAMAQIGNNAAAMVATQLLNDFPSIRFALLVGIGGGLPSQDGEDGENDVRLGDVVVSQPTGTFSGVVQYDLGKVTIDGRFERTGSLGKPPAVLSANVERLKAKHRREGSRIPELLSQVFDKYPRLGIDYAYPGAAQDQLFKATYAHQYGPTCRHCDPSQLASRSERIDKAPLIHYGTIGSANAVIKDAATRDRLKQDVPIICVEMEAAGLMDTFPCLVVRGICDYADSHKNNRWQPYAAAVAAAYMKELLSIIPAQDLLQTSDAAQITDQLRAVSLDIDRRARTDERKEILSWISSQSFAAKHQDLLAIRCEGTCEWFFKEPLFKSWKQGSVNFLWCYGIPGAGKTVLTSAIIEHLKETLKSSDVGIAYIYCEYHKQNQLTTKSLISSILHQLLVPKERIPPGVELEYRSHSRGHTELTLKECVKLLKEEVRSFSRVFIVVDALDEYSNQTGDSYDLIDELRNLSPSVSVLVTSRKMLTLENDFTGEAALEVRARDEDIKAYVRQRISRTRRLRSSIRVDPKLQERIESAVGGSASGMFLLPQLHMDAVSLAHSVEDVIQTLDTLPHGLEVSYQRALQRIRDQVPKDAELAFRILSWLSHALRPLKLEELQHGFAVQTGQGEFPRTRIIDAEILIEVCCGIVTIEASNRAIRMVHFTAQEYFQSVKDQLFPLGNLDMAISCVSYLSLESYPLLTYAATFWGCHAKHHDGDEDLFSSILSFLDSKSKTATSVQARNADGHIRHKDRFDCFEKDLLRDEGRIYSVLSQDSIGRTAFSNAVAQGHESIVRLFLDAGMDRLLSGSHGALALVHGARNGQNSVIQELIEWGAPANGFGSWKGVPLQAAARSGRTETIQILLKGGAKIDQQGPSGVTALHCAATSGALRATECLIEAGANKNAKDKLGATPLHIAAAKGHVKILDALLDAGASVNEKNDLGETALMHAASLGELDAVKLLLRRGADIHLSSNNGSQVIHFASKVVKLQRLINQQRRGVELEDNLLAQAQDGYEELVTTLIEAGADVESAPLDGDTPLIALVRVSLPHAVAVLLRHGVDPNSPSGDLMTPLHMAAISSCDESAKVLISYGANVGATDKIKATPLHYAVKMRCSKLVSLLLDGGANPDAKDSQGTTALHWAGNWAQVPESLPGLQEMLEERLPSLLEAVGLLLRRGADVNAMDDEGTTPLMRAVAGQQMELVEYLLSCGADPQHKQNDGETALIWAAATGDSKMVQTLLRYGADVASRDSKGMTPLHHGCVAGDRSTVIALLQHHADIQARDEMGLTPLHRAAMVGHVEIVEALQTRLPNVDPPDNEGRTPLFWCANILAFEKLRKTMKASEQIAPETLSCAIKFWIAYRTTASILIQHGADVNNYDATNGTVLQIAALAGHWGIVRLLVTGGADVNVKGGFKATDTIVDLLRSHSQDTVGSMSSREWAGLLETAEGGDRLEDVILLVESKVRV